MGVKAGLSGFGTDITQFLDQSQGDYIYREIRGGTDRVEIRHVRVDIGGMFIRSAGDATPNGGFVIVGRLTILRGPQGKVPPGIPVSSDGNTPNGYIQSLIQGFEFVWQSVVYGWPQQVPEKFDPGTMFAVGDKSLYVIFGSLYTMIAGTNAAPGATAVAAVTPVTMSVAGVDYSFNPTQQTGSKFASLPRYDVALPNG